jgi:AcrR family transcriptional regulator
MGIIAFQARKTWYRIIMATASTSPRIRLSPLKRRSLILDHTADIIARDGVAQISIEQIGREAGISKSLVYAYFPNLTEVLRALYQREMRRLRRLQNTAATDAVTFEDLVRSVTHEYLNYYHERGMIIDRLQHEPSVTAMHDPTDFNRDIAVDYLTRIVIDHFDLPPEIARAATDISFGLPASAGSYLLRNKIDLKTIEDLTVTMIIGTITAIKTDYVSRKQSLKRT